MHWIWICSVLFSFLKSPHAEVHAIYISVLEVELSDQGLNAEVKVFSDDLLSALKNFNKESKSIVTSIQRDEIERYFNTHLHFEVSSENLKLEIENVEEVGDSYWLKFGIELQPDELSLSVQANYFFELFPSQKNILTFKGDAGRQYFTFKSKDQTETISLHH